MERSAIRDRHCGVTSVPAYRSAHAGYAEGASVVRMSISDFSVRCTGIEIALERDRPLDTVDHALFGFALGAIGGVDLVVVEPHHGLLEWQLLAIGIEPQRHRGARAEPGE